MKPNYEKVKASLQTLLDKARKHNDVSCDVQWNDSSLVIEIETDSALAQLINWPHEHHDEGSTEWIVHEIASENDVSTVHATWGTAREFEHVQGRFLSALRDVAGIDLL